MIPDRKRPTVSNTFSLSSLSLSLFVSLSLSLSLFVCNDCWLEEKEQQKERDERHKKSWRDRRVSGRESQEERERERESWKEGENQEEKGGRVQAASALNILQLLMIQERKREGERERERESTERWGRKECPKFSQEFTRILTLTILPPPKDEAKSRGWGKEQRMRRKEKTSGRVRVQFLSKKRSQAESSLQVVSLP